MELRLDVHDRVDHLPGQHYVVRLTAEGYSAQQAADQLSLSVKTVETYRHRAMQKLGLTNRAELVQYALRAGLLTSSGE